MMHVVQNILSSNALNRFLFKLIMELLSLNSVLLASGILSSLLQCMTRFMPPNQQYLNIATTVRKLVKKFTGCVQNQSA